MAIICDNKHDENVPALASYDLRSSLEIDGERVNFQVRINVPGKQLCRQCIVEKIKKIDFASEMLKADEKIVKSR